MSTFSDLMNLLLCFFVLLFSMSSVDESKAEAMIKSMSDSFSIFSGGGASFEDGVLISSGATQLSNLDDYYTTTGQSDDGESTDNVNDNDAGASDAGNDLNDSKYGEDEDNLAHSGEEDSQVGKDDNIGDTDKTGKDDDTGKDSGSNAGASDDYSGNKDENQGDTGKDTGDISDKDNTGEDQSGNKDDNAGDTGKDTGDTSDKDNTGEDQSGNKDDNAGDTGKDTGDTSDKENTGEDQSGNKDDNAGDTGKDTGNISDKENTGEDQSGNKDDNAGDTGKDTGNISDKENVGEDQSGNKDESAGDGEKDPGDSGDNAGGKLSEDEIMSGAAQIEFDKNKAESSLMYSDIAGLLDKLNLSDSLEMKVDATSYQYVQIEISGAVLFDAGSDQVKKDAMPILSKLGDILKQYRGYKIEIIGHTDNTPTNTAKFLNNDILSACRAITVATYFAEDKGLGWDNIYYAGRGSHDPVADNSTAVGRAKNRRVEIRLYNQRSSN